MLVILIYIFIISASLFFLAIDDLSFNINNLYLSLSLSIISLLIIMVTNCADEKFRGSYIRITYLFLLGFIIVFFQKNIDLALGFINIDNEIFCNTSVINKCCNISVISLCSFGIGNYIGIIKERNEYKTTHSFDISNKFVNFQKILLIIFSLIYFYYFGSSIISGNYYYNEETMKSNAGSLGNYSNVMIYVLIFTILISNILRFKNIQNNITLNKFLLNVGLIPNLLIFCYLALNFMVGDRGPLITIFLAYVLAYFIITKVQPRLIYVITMVLFVGIFLAKIGEIRRFSTNISVSDVISNNGGHIESILPFTDELAGSYKTFTYVVNDIPSNHDYFYGMMQIREIILAVPFMNRFITIFNSPYPFENSSTSYCSYLIQGLNRTYGNGSSLLANIYLDFGLFGIILIMICLGLFMYRMDLEIYTGFNVYWITISLVFFSFSLYLSRATLTTPLYYIIPCYVIMCMRSFLKE